jgi:hypothetical protein
MPKLVSDLLGFNGVQASQNFPSRQIDLDDFGFCFVFGIRPSSAGASQIFRGLKSGRIADLHDVIDVHILDSTLPAPDSHRPHSTIAICVHHSFHQ